MNKLVTSILKASSVDAKVTSDKNNPKFRVVNSNLTLEGMVTKNKYSMTIKDNKGKIIDSLSVSIKNGNDIANRINESIETLNKLSPIYDKNIKLQEDEEFEDIPSEEPGDIKSLISGLTETYESIINIAETVKRLMNNLEVDDVNNKTELLSIVGDLYDTAIDIDDFKESMIELMEEPEQVDENIQPKKGIKLTTKSVINNLSESEVLLKGHKDLTDIKEAIKAIKSELIVRGK